MKAITDPQVITASNPFDLASYLRAHGWRRGNAISEGRAHLWLHQIEADNIDVIVPADRTVRDYRARMIEALQTLEAIEQRSQLEIIADIQQASADIIRWRIIQDDSSDGTIPLEDGQLFITQVRSQLLAAACAAAQPMQFFANRKPAAATEYMRQTRLGQSERGSYVVTVLSPVPPALPLHGADEQPDPFERRVSLTGCQRTPHPTPSRHGRRRYR